MYSVFVPAVSSHWRSCLVLNSGPLSKRMCSDLPCSSIAWPQLRSPEPTTIADAAEPQDSCGYIRRSGSAGTHCARHAYSERRSPTSIRGWHASVAAARMIRCYPTSVLAASVSLVPLALRGAGCTRPDPCTRASRNAAAAPHRRKP